MTGDLPKTLPYGRPRLLAPAIAYGMLMVAQPAAAAIAAISLLSSFALLTAAPDVTPAVGCFAMLAWLAATSVTLPRDRRATRKLAGRLTGETA